MSTSSSSYDLIVIGAGQGGGPLAGAYATAGHATALIERSHVGGTCVNEGCTPTKTMIASARAAYVARRAADFGVDVGSVSVNLETVRDRKRTIVKEFRSGSRNTIESNENLDLIEGEGTFMDANTVAVTNSEGAVRHLTADRIVINTGEHPFIPPINGLDKVDFLTSTSIMELGHIPDHLLVLGGGSIGLEFGQMFRRFGSEVTLIEMADRILPREDADVSEAVQEILEDEGIRVLPSTRLTLAQQHSDGTVSVALDGPRCPTRLRGTHLLVASGRRPSTEALDLEAAGVETDDRGYVQVTDRLETSAEGIYAIGDVKGGPAFTHIAYDDFRVLRDRWLHGADRPIADRLVAYTLFTDPQLGRVGLSEAQARDQGREVQVAQLPMRRVARALEVNEARGFMKAVVDPNTHQILGATVLGPEGGEIMSILQMAMMGNVPYTTLRETPFAHPTYAESLNTLFAELDAG